MVNTDVRKGTSDFLNVIKTGHSGSIAGNPAHAGMSQTKVYMCNAHADISDYKDLALSDKETEALLQNCTTKIILGKTGEGKKTDMRTGMGVVQPSRILDIED
ncbi:hypothetical protein ZW22_004391 [Salmonella enterica subsp. enterica serovar Oranienburg]|nr:hypothetical protein [Salmonella enterica subsp. enterica serovar Oranienburg]